MIDMEELRSTGEFSDITVNVGCCQLRLHRFPLMASSNYFRDLLRGNTAETAVVDLHGLPGGYSAMKLAADFCYGLPVYDTLSTCNIGHVICAASHLQMSGSRNLLQMCKSKLIQLTEESTTNCLAILVNCVDVAELVDREGVASQCIQSAADQWSSASGCPELTGAEDTSGTNSNFLLPPENAISCSMWNSLIKQLPSSWMCQILEELQRRKCKIALITSSTAACIDVVIECYNNHDEETHLQKLSMERAVTTMTVFQRSKDEKENQQSAEITSTTESTKDKVFTTDKDQLARHLKLVPISSSMRSETLLWAFEALITYIPYTAATLGCLPPCWFVRTLNFASVHSLKSSSHLRDICASIYDQLVDLEDVQELDPDVVSELSKEASSNDFQTSVEQLTDAYLNHRTARRAITGVQFASVLNAATTRCRRISSYDKPFEALEIFLKSSPSLPNADSWKAINSVDFTKLSQVALARAAENDHIPSKVISKAAVAVCEQLRRKLEKLESQPSPSGVWVVEEEPDKHTMEITTNPQKPPFPVRVSMLSKRSDRKEFIASKAVFMMPLTRQGAKSKLKSSPSNLAMQWTEFDFSSGDNPPFLIYDSSDETLYDPVLDTSRYKPRYLKLRKWTRTETMY